MAGCVRKCKRNAPMESSASSVISKKPKFESDIDEDKKPNLQAASDFELGGSRSSAVSAADSSDSGGVLVWSLCTGESPESICSSTESGEVSKDGLGFVDPEAQSFETEISTCINNFSSPKRDPPTEFVEDTDCMDPQTAKTSRRNPPTVKTPSQEEIEEFFSAAEKEEQKRFVEKYNYDVVKDAPLEGRYEWIRLKP